MPRLLQPRLLLIAAALLFLAGVAAAVQFVLLESYRRLEAEAIGQSTEQVVRALEAELRQIRVVANDYARWDDMYDFVEGLDPAFIDENFSEKGLREMEIDAVWVFDQAATPVFSARQDPDARSYAIPADPDLTVPVQSGLRRLVAAAEAQGLALLALPQGLALATAHPIVRSDRSGPARGVLVMLRILRPGVVTRLAEVSQLPVSLGRFGITDPRSVAPGVSAWRTGRGTMPDRLTWTPGDDRIEGYALLRDLEQRPVGWLATYTPRDIHQQGQRTAVVLLVAIAVLTLLALLATVAFDQRAARSRRRAEDSEALYRAVVEQAGEGIVIADPNTHRILQANPALAALTGVEETRWRDQTVDALLMPASVPLFMSRIAGEEGASAGGSCEIELRTAQNEARLVEFHANRLRLDDGEVLCLVFRDVSQRKQAEAVLLDQQKRLEHLANHDALTGLPNRLYLNFRLPGLIAEAERERLALAVCYIDVDNFKNINDSSGHDVGDDFLRALAERLRHVVSGKDLVARISGDEFVVVSAARDPRIFDAIARRVTGHLRNPVRVNGREMPSSVSMGIAVYPQDGEDAAELLRNADIALYQAKERGRDTYQFFVREMNERVRERMRLEEALREGLQADQFGVEFQPVIDLRTGRIAALEALARWRHPVLGQVPPGQFIPIAEEAGLIVELGETILRRVCMQIAAWRMDGVPIAPVAVNVSAQQLQRSNIRDRVLAICSEIGVQPRMLQIELTESALMREIDRQIAALEGLRAAGVAVSIDDFGTGYSSLSYLKHLPIDHLKIDRSFVRDMAVDANDAAIVSAIIGMARSLRLETIAEGVETSQHAMRLASLGCNFAQGFYYSPPLSAENTEKLLRDIASRGGVGFQAPLTQRALRR